MSRGIGPNSPQSVVPQRWGYPFWDVVRDMADQGLSRAQTAKALGYRSRRFEVLLRNNPHLDPFEPRLVVATYIRDTGEGFRAALERMAAAHYTLAAASREIGFSTPEALAAAMRDRGVYVRFKRFDVIGAYERKHRTTLAQSLVAMSAKGFSRNAAAKAIGLNSGAALKYQMQIRGIQVEFPRRARSAKPRAGGKHPWRTYSENAIQNSKRNIP